MERVSYRPGSVKNQIFYLVEVLRGRCKKTVYEDNDMGDADVMEHEGDEFDDEDHVLGGETEVVGSAHEVEEGDASLFGDDCRGLDYHSSRLCDSEDRDEDSDADSDEDESASDEDESEEEDGGDDDEGNGSGSEGGDDE